MPRPTSFCSKHLNGVPRLKDGGLVCDQCDPPPFCSKHPTAGTRMSHGRKLCKECDPYIPGPAEVVGDRAMTFANELQEIGKALVESGYSVFVPGGPVSMLVAFGPEVQRLRELACDFSPGPNGIEGVWGRSIVHRVLALPGFWALEKRERRDGAWGYENPTYITYWQAGASFVPGEVTWAEGPTAEAACGALLLKQPLVKQPGADARTNEGQPS